MSQRDSMSLPEANSSGDLDVLDSDLFEALVDELAPVANDGERRPPGPSVRPDSWRPGPHLPVQGRYGRFDILGRLARGGMGEVLLAREHMADGSFRHVAIKRIPPGADDDETLVNAFLSEARLVMQLSHPHICHVYDVGHEGGSWYLTMEWIHGASLQRLIHRMRARGQPIPPAIVARVIADVASGLGYAHRARDADGTPLGLVHRDVSPHNIMIGFDGSVKLLDFGIAKAATQHDRTQTGIIKGKCAYMAPEQCLGHALDHRTDVFALGICLYEALSGEPLFRRHTSYATLTAVVSASTPRLPARAGAAALDAIVQRATQKRPEARYPEAEGVQLSLEHYLGRQGHLAGRSGIAELMRDVFADEVAHGPRLGTLCAEPAHRTPSGPAGECAPEPGVSPPRRPRRGRQRIPFALLAALAMLVGPGLEARGGDESPAQPVLSTTRSVTNLPPAASTDASAPAEADAFPEPAPATEAQQAHARAPGNDPGSGDATAKADDARRSERPARASLSINTEPWSYVYVRGRSLGATPLGEVRVRAGRVRLKLVDRDGKVHWRVLRLRPGRHVRRYFRLDHEGLTGSQ